MLCYRREDFISHHSFLRGMNSVLVDTKKNMLFLNVILYCYFLLLLPSCCIMGNMLMRSYTRLSSVHVAGAGVDVRPVLCAAACSVESACSGFFIRNSNTTTSTDTNTSCLLIVDAEVSPWQQCQGAEDPCYADKNWISESTTQSDTATATQAITSLATQPEQVGITLEMLVKVMPSDKKFISQLTFT